MKFKPGQSGNPKGRPKRGTTDAEKLREAIARHVPEIINTLCVAALSGDAQAARLLLERALPALKPVQEPVRIALDADTLAGKAADVLSAVSRGDLAADSAKQLLDGLASVARITETDELERRIAALEARP